MRNHRKIKALRSAFGIAGYGCWVMFLEHLTGAEQNYFTYNDLEVELLAGDFGLPPEQLKNILDYCIKIELLNHKGGVIWSRNLDDRLESVYRKRGDKESFRDGNPRFCSDNSEEQKNNHFLPQNVQKNAQKSPFFEENKNNEKGEKESFCDENHSFCSENHSNGDVSATESTHSKVKKSKEEEKKYIKKDFSDFLSGEKILPDLEKFTPDPQVEKSLKKLKKSGQVDLEKIEEKFFPGKGIVGVIFEFQKYFHELGYSFKSDNATLGCFLAWTNRLKTNSISAQLDAKIPEKVKLDSNQEQEYAKFLNLRHRHGEIGQFLNKETGKEKEELIRALIAKYGLPGLVRKIYEYGALSIIGSNYNSISHFQSWEPNLKLPENKWQEIVKGQELEDAINPSK